MINNKDGSHFFNTYHVPGTILNAVNAEADGLLLHFQRKAPETWRASVRRWLGRGVRLGSLSPDLPLQRSSSQSCDENGAIH